VVKDDFPINHEGILGIDFLQKQQATCDLGKKRLHIDDIKTPALHEINLETVK